MENQIYEKLDVKDSEGNIVGFSFVEREKIPLLESLSMVPQGQSQNSISVSLEEDLDLSSSDDDEDLHKSSHNIQQESGSSVSSSASTSHDQGAEEVEMEVGLDAGWLRICKVGEGESITVSYKSPDGKIFRKMYQVSKYLGEQESNLSKENFSFEKKFLGFERDHETISISESFHGQVSDPQTQEDPPEQGKSVWLRGGRLAGVQCLVCNQTFGGKYSKSNLVRHLKNKHSAHQDPKRICTKCGKSFSRKFYLKVHIENDKCKGKVQDSSSRRLGSPNQKTKTTGATVKEGPSVSPAPAPASATVLIESPVVGGYKELHVKLRSSRVMGEFLDSLLLNSGFEPGRVEWLCDERLLTGEETAGLLHNKTVKYRFKS